MLRLYSSTMGVPSLPGRRLLDCFFVELVSLGLGRFVVVVYVFVILFGRLWHEVTMDWLVAVEGDVGGSTKGDDASSPTKGEGATMRQAPMHGDDVSSRGRVGGGTGVGKGLGGKG
jgi:hypothetical protein